MKKKFTLSEKTLLDKVLEFEINEVKVPNQLWFAEFLNMTPVGTRVLIKRLRNRGYLEVNHKLTVTPKYKEYLDSVKPNNELPL